jgi:hypothetical protein
MTRILKFPGKTYSRRETSLKENVLQDNTGQDHASGGETESDSETGNPLENYETPKSDSHTTSDKIDPNDPVLQVPIALRKPVRECTKHPLYPLTKYVSYDKLSPQYQAFISTLSSIKIPKNIQEALSEPEWRVAVHEEIKALEKNDTWDVVSLPEVKVPVGCRWVFTVKYNSDGTLQRYKARLVAKGYTQTYGLDYSETFSPVAKLNTVRILLSVAVNRDWSLEQLDVKNAFLHGNLKEVYMDIPPGFAGGSGSKVCKLKKSLYGLKQSPRAWFERFMKFLKNEGFKQGHSDHTLFVKRSLDGKLTILVVYVDDIILTGDDQVGRIHIKSKLAKEFEIKELGSLKYFLGMEFARSNKGLVVSQRKYVLDLLEETGMSECKPAATPMESDLKSWEKIEGVPVDKGRYQRLVGKLIYLAHTRPDISFAVGVVSQFMHDPCVYHLEAVMRILRYLKGTVGEGLWFRKSTSRTIEVYTDSDWAGSKERRSTSGYCSYVWGNLVTWRSKKQGVVARSTAEAEFRAMA